MSGKQVPTIVFHAAWVHQKEEMPLDAVAHFAGTLINAPDTVNEYVQKEIFPPGTSIGRYYVLPKTGPNDELFVFVIGTQEAYWVEDAVIEGEAWKVYEARMDAAREQGKVQYDVCMNNPATVFRQV